MEACSHTQVRQLHAHALAGRVNLRPQQIYSAEVRSDASLLARLASALEVPLAAYIDGGSGQIGFGRTKRKLGDFAKAAVRAAAIASPEEAVAAIERWASGGPWIETRTTILKGIAVESPMAVAAGVSVGPLPDRPPDPGGRAPGLAVDCLRGPPPQSGADVRGAAVLRSEEYRRPVFWPAGQPPARIEESALPGGIGGLPALLRALSLVCNAHVEPQGQWCASAPLLRAFEPGNGEAVDEPPRPGHGPAAPPVPLTQPLLDEALRVAKRLQDAPKAVSELVDRVVSRWTESLCGRPAPDRLIDARIALESLFAGQGAGGAGLRVAYHGARYLGGSPEERRRLFDDLNAIHATASTLVRGGAPKPSRDLRKLAHRAQTICRDAVLKLADDSEIPDWTDLMLNGR